jgi:hypothetical protein
LGKRPSTRDRDDVSAGPSLWSQIRPIDDKICKVSKYYTSHRWDCSIEFNSQKTDWHHTGQVCFRICKNYNASVFRLTSQNYWVKCSLFNWRISLQFSSAIVSKEEL